MQHRTKNSKELVMQPQALTAVLLFVLVSGCGQGSETSTISPGEVGHLAQAINYSVTDTVAADSWKYLTISAPAGLSFVASITPTSGDPDLYVTHLLSDGTMETLAQSENGDLKVDKVAVKRPADESITFYIHGYTASDFNFALSWPSLGKMDLNVPYLNQNTVSSSFGSSACGCTSLEMILAYWGKVTADPDSMKARVRLCYPELGSGSPSSTGIKNRLLDPSRGYNFSSVVITAVGSLKPEDLYAKIRDEIHEGRPMIISSWRFTRDGHFVVVIGVTESSYSSTAKIIVHDPFGPWGEGGPNDYPPTSYHLDGKGVAYNFDKVIADDPGHGKGNLITIK